MLNFLSSLLWIEELLPADVIQKRMLGGMGYYLDEKLVLILIESSRTREYKGITYPFEVLNGCFFPVEKIKQNTVWAKFNFLENHPIHKRCLYLPAESQDIEDEVKLVIREIKKRNPLFGILVKGSSAEKRIIESSPEVKSDSIRPSLFNTGPVAKKAIIKMKDPLKKVKANKKPGNAHLLSLLKRRN